MVGGPNKTTPSAATGVATNNPVKQTSGNSGNTINSAIHKLNKNNTYSLYYRDKSGDNSYAYAQPYMKVRDNRMFAALASIDPTKIFTAEDNPKSLTDGLKGLKAALGMWNPNDPVNDEANKAAEVAMFDKIKSFKDLVPRPGIYDKANELAGTLWPNNAGGNVDLIGSISNSNDKQQIVELLVGKYAGQVYKDAVKKYCDHEVYMQRTPNLQGFDDNATAGLFDPKKDEFHDILGNQFAYQTFLAAYNDMPEATQNKAVDIHTTFNQALNVQ